MDTHIGFESATRGSVVTCDLMGQAAFEILVFFNVLATVLLKYVKLHYPGLKFRTAFAELFLFFIFSFLF